MRFHMFGIKRCQVVTAFLFGVALSHAHAVVTAADVTRDGMHVLASHGGEDKALLLFERAAKMGDANAGFRAGLMYQAGRGAKRDDALAARYFKSAATKGQVDAQYEFAEALMDGRGVGKDEKEATAWYERAAKQGHLPSTYNAALNHHQGRGVEKNLQVALGLYTVAAVAGHPMAQNNLGHMLLKGEGVGKDVHQAKKYFEASARQNDVSGLYSLATLYRLGQAGEINPQLSMRLYLQAAMQGDGESQLVVGLMYAKGWGVAKDMKISEFWLSKAHAGGHPRAGEVLKKLQSFQ